MSDEALVEELRAAWSRRPTGVCALAARSGSTDLVATVTDVVSASLHPPMVLALLYTESRLRESVDVGSTWALSLLGGTPAARAAARQLAEPGRPLLGQLTGIAHHRGVTGAALLDESSAWIECRTAWVRNAGDHDVIAADVLAVELGDVGVGASVHHMGRITPTAGRHSAG